MAIGNLRETRKYISSNKQGKYRAGEMVCGESAGCTSAETSVQILEAHIRS